MSDFVLDASLTLQWFLEDEADRAYSLAVLSSFSKKSALVPALWFYEVGNGLLMAFRRKRIQFAQVEEFLSHLRALPIEAAQESSFDLLGLPRLAHERGLTNYDAAYLSLALRSKLPLATNDNRLRLAANAVAVHVLKM